MAGEITDGLVLNVTVTHIHSEGKWIKLFVQFDEIGPKQLSRSLHESADHFERSPAYLYPQQIPLGTNVCAKFHDGKWYRAKVVAYPPNNQLSVTVQLIDYGNIEIISVKDLRKGDTYLFQVGPQAIECYLADICAPTSWPQEAVQLCNELVIFQDNVVGEVVGHFEAFPIVRLFKDDLSISKSLMSQGFGIPVGSSDAKHNPPISPNPPMIHYPQQQFKNMALPPGYQPQPQAPPPVARSTIFSGESYHAVPLDPNRQFRVYLSHIVNCHKFYVQLSSDEIERNKIAHSINMAVTHSPSRLESWGPGTPCLAQCSEDNIFQRAIIMGFNGHTGNCQVFFVDSGITEEKDAAGLQSIPRLLVQFPLQAFECSLETRVIISTAMFRSFAVGKVFDLHILAKSGIQYIVQLFFQNQNLLNFIHIPPHLSSMQTLPTHVAKLITFRHPTLNRGDSYLVEISHYDSPVEFYCQLSGNAMVLDEVTKQMNQFYSDPTNVQRVSEYNCKLGYPVAIYNPDENCWYRAEISGPVLDGDVEVRCIDLGTQLGSRVHDLFALTPQLVEQTAQAVKFSMEGFESLPQNVVSAEHLMRVFDDLTVNQILQAEVVNVIGERHYSVVLNQTQNAESPSGLSINQQLLMLSQNPQTPTMSLPVADVVVPPPELCEIEDITIVHYVSPQDFFGQLTKIDLVDFENFEEQIQNFYKNKTAKPFPLKVNQFVCAKFSDNEAFYRAKILSLQGNEAEVLFIDFGNREMRDATNIFPLEPVFAKQPQMGIKCFFKDFPKTAPADKLSDLMTENLIQVKILGQSCDGYAVELTADSALNEDILNLLHPPPAVLSKINFALGGMEDVEITDVKDFSQFSCQLLRNRKELDDIMAEIEDFYGTQLKGDPLRNFQVDAACAAKYSDEGWYRGRIISIPSPGNCEVLFVDYGNTEIRPASDLRILKPEFYRLPELGLSCCLSDIQDINASPENIKKFKDLMVDKTFSSVYNGLSPTNKNLHLVTLQKGPNKNIVSEFLKMKPSSSHNSSFNDDNIFNNTNDRANRNQSKNTFKSEPTVNTFQNNNDRGASGGAPATDNWNSHSGNGDARSPPRSITKTSSPLKQTPLTDFQHQTINPMSYEDVTVVHVASPSEFYCQITKTLPQLFLQTEKISQIYNGSVGVENIRGIKPDDPCAAFSGEHGTWYRGRIYNVLGRNIEVEFIDNGHKEMVPTEKVKMLKPEFFQLPIQALKCSLFNTLPPNGNTWDAAAIESFKKKVANRTMICQFVEVGPKNTFKVTLIAPGNVFNNEFVADGFGKSESKAKDTLKLPFYLSMGADLKREQIAIGTKEKVEVTWMITPTEFICQRSSTQNAFKNLMEKIQALYSGLTELEGIIESPQPGMYCITQFSEDGAWYRARINHVKGNKVGLFYVDYGNSEEVTRKFTKLLVSSFQEMPMQAIRCKLRNVKTDQSPTANIIEKYYYGEPVCTFVQPLEDGAYLVDLENNGKNVAQTLVSDGLAVQDAAASAAPVSVGQAPRQTESYKEMKLSLGEHDVVVIYAESPHVFYCQAKLSPEFQVDELMAQIALHYSQPQNQIQTSNFVSGAACIAKYTVDNQWYRATVCSVDPKTNFVEVQFVDYGNVDFTSKAQILSIVPQFMKAPIQAFHCSLYGVPIDVDEDLTTKFCEAVDSQDFKLKINSVENGVCIVSLKDESGKDVGKEIFGSILIQPPTLVQPPTLEEKIPVYVSHIETIESCFIQLASQEKDLNDLMANVATYCTEENPNSIDPKELVVNSMCCALYSEDETWYRATILSVNDDGVLVLFADYGNQELVAPTSIKPITSVLSSQAPFITECSLHAFATIPTKNIEAIDEFQKLVSEKDLQAIILKTGAGKSVQLFNEDGNVGEQLLAKQLVVPKPIEAEPSSGALALTPTLEEKIPVYVSHIETIESCFIQLASQEKDLNDLMANLATYCTEGNPSSIDPKELAVNSMCCALYSEDGTWYRATILSVNDEGVLVRFVDYGNEELVAPASVKPITSVLSSQAPFIIECSLHDFVAIPTKNREAIDEFLQLVTDRVLQAIFFKTGAFTSAQLFNDDGDVGKQLLAKQLVVPRPIEAKPSGGASTLTSTKTVTKPVGLQQAFVSHIDGLHAFYLQLNSQVDALYLFAQSLQDSVASLLPMNSVDITPGVICCTLFSDDNAWYRAKVLEVNGDNVLVRFIDYGNSDTSAKNSVKQLNQAMLDIPPYAISCQLATIEAVPGQETQAIDHFFKITSDIEFAVTFEGSEEPFSVQLSSENGDITETLLATESVVAKPQASVSSNIVTAGTESALSSLSLISYPKHDLISTGTVLEMVVSHISGLDSFFMQRKSSEADIEKLEGELECLYTDAEKSLDIDEGRVCIGMPCVAQFAENEAWYRAEVLHVHGTDVTVRFVDYGNEDVVDLTKLKILAESFFYAPFAIQCQFSELQPMQDSEANVIEYFTNLAIEKTVTTTFKDVKVRPYDVELQLKDAENTVTDALKASNLVMSRDPSENIQIEVSLTNLPKFKPVEIPTEEAGIIVSHVSTLNLVYIQLASQADSFANFSNLLEQFYSTGEGATLATLTIGMACCSKFSADESWYRAEIVSIEGNDVTVKFVDYGNSDVTTADCIKELTDELLDPPPFAIRCVLKNIEPTETDFGDAFLELIKDKTLSAHFEGQVEPISVTLFENGVGFADQLVTSGLAKLKEVSAETLSDITDYPNPIIPLNHKHLVNVTHVNTPNDFWVQLPEAAAELEKIQPMLFDGYSSLGESELVLSSPKIGQSCVTLFEDDGLYYRGKVLETLETNVNVLLVDYGNTTLTDNQNVKQIKPELLVSPPLAIQCSLLGVTAKTGHWEPEICDQLSDRLSVDEKTFLMHFVSLDELVVQVRLFDMGLDIAVSLIQCGQAIKGPDGDQNVELGIESGVVLVDQAQADVTILDAEVEVTTESVTEEVTVPQGVEEVEIPQTGEKDTTVPQAEEKDIVLQAEEKDIVLQAEDMDTTVLQAEEKNTFPQTDEEDTVLLTEDIITVEQTPDLHSQKDPLKAESDENVEVAESKTPEKESKPLETRPEPQMTPPLSDEDSGLNGNEVVVPENESEEISISPYHRPSSREDKIVPGVISQGILDEEEAIREVIAVQEEICRNRNSRPSSRQEKILPGILSGIISPDEPSTSPVESPKKSAQNVVTVPYARPQSREDSIVPGIIALGLLQEEQRQINEEEWEKCREKAYLNTPKKNDEKLLSGFHNNFEDDSEEQDDLVVSKKQEESYGEESLKNGSMESTETAAKSELNLSSEVTTDTDVTSSAEVTDADVTSSDDREDVTNVPIEASSQGLSCKVQLKNELGELSCKVQLAKDPVMLQDTDKKFDAAAESSKDSKNES